MIGTTRPSHQRFPVALAGAAVLAACSGGGGSAANLAPTIVTAAFVGVATPSAGDQLLLFFSEDVAVGTAAFTDADVVLSGNATLGAVASAPTAISARAVSVTLGAGVSFTPGVTAIAFSAANDCIRDLGGLPGSGGSPITIGTSDGTAPTLSNVTIAGIDDALNGTGPAGGTLQVPPSGWTIDLAFTDNGAVVPANSQVTATVDVSTASGVQPAGANLMPFLIVSTSDATSARLAVPATVVFPAAPFTLSCVVVDASGLASAAVSLPATCSPFTDALRPFETGTNPGQVWFLDFTRDVESFTTSAIPGGVSVDVQSGANGRSDFEDVLHVLGLLSSSPLPNVSGGLDSNQVAAANLKNAILTNLASLYAGANVTFTLTQPSPAFGSTSSVGYGAIGYSQIAIAGAASSAGVLGVAIFDPSNATQNDDTRTDFAGVRLGVFLHTIADTGMGPPGSSLFRTTFGPLSPSLGGAPVGSDAQDGARLLGDNADGRGIQITTAIGDLGRFLAVVTAHECGHSMGLVRNGAMPVGLYGNDATNFPGSQDGHIRTASLFPAGATNVMSPSLAYSTALHPATAFNSLNLAYLREQVFYGN